MGPVIYIKVKRLPFICTQTELSNLMEFGGPSKWETERRNLILHPGSDPD